MAAVLDKHQQGVKGFRSQSYGSPLKQKCSLPRVQAEMSELVNSCGLLVYSCFHNSFTKISEVSKDKFRLRGDTSAHALGRDLYGDAFPSRESSGECRRL